MGNKPLTNNPPDVIIELTKEQAEFLLENCAVNIDISLRGLTMMQQTGSLDNLKKLVDLIENFKALKCATEKGMNNG